MHITSHVEPSSQGKINITSNSVSVVKYFRPVLVARAVNSSVKPHRFIVNFYRVSLSKSGTVCLSFWSGGYSIGHSTNCKSAQQSLVQDLKNCQPFSETMDWFIGYNNPAKYKTRKKLKMTINHKTNLLAVSWTFILN